MARKFQLTLIPCYKSFMCVDSYRSDNKFHVAMGHEASLMSPQEPGI